MSSNSTGKSRRSKRGLGRLYKRGRNGKEYPADSKIQGVYYLEYRVDRDRIRQKLTDETGQPITTIRAAREEQKRIMAPYVSKGKVEQLQAVTAKLKAAEQKQQLVFDDVNPPLAIADSWEAYLNSGERNDSDGVTLGNYKGHWNRLIEWLESEHPDLVYLRDITPQMANDFLKTRSSSPNTYNKTLTFIRSFCDVLAEPARLDANPFAKLKRKKLATQSRRPLTLDELRLILTQADGDLEMLLALGTFTGLRLGDCCTLKWVEIDLLAEVIRRVPNKTRSRKHNPVVVGIPPMLAGLLHEVPQKSRKGFILPKVAAQYAKDETAITKSIQRHFEACGIKTHKEGTGKGTGKRAVVEVGFHSLRHTYVTLHAERGTPQAFLQAVVGHSNPQMTQSYTHISEGIAKQLGAVIDLGEEQKQSALEPIPIWVVDKLQSMTTDNWHKVRQELLEYRDPETLQSR